MDQIELIIGIQSIIEELQIKALSQAHNPLEIRHRVIYRNIKYIVKR